MYMYIHAAEKLPKLIHITTARPNHLLIMYVTKCMHIMYIIKCMHIMYVTKCMHICNWAATKYSSSSMEQCTGTQACWPEKVKAKARNLRQIETRFLYLSHIAPTIYCTRITVTRVGHGNLQSKGQNGHPYAIKPTMWGGKGREVGVLKDSREQNKSHEISNELCGFRHTLWREKC